MQEIEDEAFDTSLLREMPLVPGGNGRRARGDVYTTWYRCRHCNQAHQVNVRKDAFPDEDSIYIHRLLHGEKKEISSLLYISSNLEIMSLEEWIGLPGGRARVQDIARVLSQKGMASRHQVIDVRDVLFFKLLENGVPVKLYRNPVFSHDVDVTSLLNAARMTSLSVMPSEEATEFYTVFPGFNLGVMKLMGYVFVLVLSDKIPPALFIQLMQEFLELLVE